MSAGPMDAMLMALARAAAADAHSLIKDELRTLVRDEIRAAFEAAETDSVIGTDGLAELLGCPTSTAAKRRVDRDLELQKLALTGGGGTRWTWKRSDILALLARRRAERGGR